MWINILLMIIIKISSLNGNLDTDSSVINNTITLSPYSHKYPTNISSILLFHDAIAVPISTNSTNNIKLTIVSNGIKSIFCGLYIQIRIFCYTSIDVRKANYECLSEDHAQKYTGILVHCGKYQLKNHKTFKYVQIKLKSFPFPNGSKSILSDPLLISHSYRPSKTPEMAVFVRPIYGELKMRYFREFVAFYLLNGFKRIVVYTYNLDEARLLSNISGVQLFEYRIPSSVINHIHAGGQLGAIHHFWLANIDTEQLYVDMDEFVFVRNCAKLTMPMLFYSWIDVYFRNFNATYDSLNFRTRLFCDEKNNLFNTTELQLDNNVAQVELHPHNERSKVFVLNPRSIHLLQIHEVKSFKSSKNNYNLNVEHIHGEIHHHRPCEGILYPQYIFDIGALNISDYVDNSFQTLSRFYDTRKRILEFMNEK